MSSGARRRVGVGTSAVAVAGSLVRGGPRAFDPDLYCCAVCGDWGDDDVDGGDYLFSCRGCGLWVHAGCYGEQYIASAGPMRARTLSAAAAARPAHAFTCAVCTANVTPGTCACEICGRDVTIERAAKALTTSDPRKSGKKSAYKPTAASRWVHLMCASWSGEVDFFDADGKDFPRFLPHSVKALGTCVICEAEGRKHTGRAMQCHHSGCDVFFHAICGREKGWELLSNDAGAHGVDLVVYCGAHTSKKHMQAMAACDEACERCGKDDRPAELLLCDHCDRGYHMSCLTPQLASAPEGAWFCSGCSQSGAARGEGAGAGSKRRGRTAAASAGAGAGAGALSPPPSKVSSVRILGPDAELPNTYFVNVARKRLKPDDAPAVPPVIAMAPGALEDPTQLHWAAAAAKADVEALVSIYVPLLVGLRAVLTVSSVGDPLPAAWHLAASCAAATQVSLMMVKLDDLPHKALPHAGVIVVTGVAAAAPAAWRLLPDADLIIILLQDNYDLLNIPQHVLRERVSVSSLRRRHLD